MSTKIYDGKKLRYAMSVWQLNEFYKKLRSELIAIAQQEYYKLVAKVAQAAYVYLLTGENICDYTIDMKSLDENKEGCDAFNVLFFARKQVDTMIKKTKDAILWSDAEPDADFNVSLCILPIPDKILCIPHANHTALYEKLMKIPEFEDYGYWNNTDKPSNVSDEEWERRKQDWNEALPGIGVPRENGMVVNIVDSVYDVVYTVGDVAKNILPYLKSDEELRKIVAKCVILQREYEKYAEEYGDNWSSHAYSLLRKAQKYVEENAEEVCVYVEKHKDFIKSVEFFKSIDLHS